MNGHLPAGPAARALLGWTQELLADSPGRADRALKRLSPIGSRCGTRLGSRAEGARGRRHRVPIVRPRRGRRLVRQETRQPNEEA
jgi:hypothetical protein